MDQTKEKEITTVTTVAEYLEILSKKIANHPREKDDLVVYRGEPQAYPIPCRANIFREDKLSNNYCFERNLFDAMRQQGITKEIKYLYNAIDAQHGEFPSRLLDVSYNCMTALYFAVTGFYKRGDACEDGHDGMVYIFFIDEVFSPSSINTNEAYETIINRDKKWFTDQIIFEKNHKFIDHGKLNQRVIAQQGAFILFQGNDATPIPEYMIERIRIPKEYKKKLREELKMYFGIHTGSIYPELTNLVTEMTNKSKMINSNKFEFDTEIEAIFRTFKKEIEFLEDIFYECAKNWKTASDRKMDEEFLRACKKMEETCKSYSDSIVAYNTKFAYCTESETAEFERISECLKEFKEKYNMYLEYLMEKYLEDGILDEEDKINNELELDLGQFEFIEDSVGVLEDEESK